MKITVFNIVSVTVLLFASILDFSCSRSSSVSSVKRDELFSMEYGAFENQLNLFNLSSTGTIDTRLAMRNGFFYISNGEAQKILQLNSYGDLLTLYHNPESNPIPIFDGAEDESGNTSAKGAVVSTRKTVEYPFDTPSLIAIDSRQNIFCVETLPRERQEQDNGMTLRQVILRFYSDSFAGYIGQQGLGGTPFPFIKNIYTKDDDSLVVVCVVPDGMQVYTFNPEGHLVSSVLVKSSDIPNPYKEKVDANIYIQLENVVPDISSKSLFVKADYYETSVDNASKIQSGIDYAGTYVFPLDVVTGKYEDGIAVPPYEDTFAEGFSKQVFNLPYDFLGVTSSGWLFFSIAVDNGYMIEMVHSSGSKILKRKLIFDNTKVVYHNFSLSDSGIISALLALKDKVQIVWWRTDSIL